METLIGDREILRDDGDRCHYHDQEHFLYERGVYVNHVGNLPGIVKRPDCGKQLHLLRRHVTSV